MMTTNLNVLAVLLGIGLFFGCFGALTSFIIVYDEYRKHGLTRRQLVGKSLRTSATAFLVLVLLVLAVGLFIAYIGR
jgi:heme A synthase